MTRYPLYFVPGDDETRVFQYKDDAGSIVNITGYSATFVATINDVSVTKTGTVEGSTGKVQVSLTHTNTSALGQAGKNGSYTLFITSGGLITTIATGPITMLQP